VAWQVIGTVQVAHHRHGGHDGNEDYRRSEDDLDGGPADETVRFAVGGTDYEIDLIAKNAAAFRQQLARYLQHAPQASQPTAARAGADTASRERSADIWAWAKDQGIALSGCGRILANIAQQYQAAMGQP
jgi:hypothetical protein